VVFNFVFFVFGEMGGMEIYVRELLLWLVVLEGVELIVFVNCEAVVDCDVLWG